MRVKVSGQANFPAGKGIQAIINIRPFNGGYVNSLETTYPCDSTSWCDYAIAFKASDTHTNANRPASCSRCPPPLQSTSSIFFCI